MPDFLFLFALSAEAWLVIALLSILLASLLFYFFEFSEFELTIPP